MNASANSPVVRSPDAASLRQAAELLRADELCAFPTETVYGLGGHALSPKAVERIYQTKGRPSSNPLIIHVPGIAEARELADDWPEVAEALAQRFWPGPLTLVVPRSDRVPAIVSAGLGTMAIRAPAHPVAQALLQTCRLPLAAPSANRSERVSPTTPDHVLKAGLPGLRLILDGGPCQCGIESTVVDITSPVPRLLRPGALAVSRLREVIPNLRLPDSEAIAEPSRSPGMMARHYAPRARLMLVDRWEDIDGTILKSPIGLIAMVCDEAPILEAATIERLGDDPMSYAADLYAALHRLDDAGVATIVAIRPPHDESWLAVRDRLTRAAAI